MASLEKRKGSYRVVFRYAGKKFSTSLKTKSRTAATASVARLEDNLRRLELGTLSLPDEADLAYFLLSDGKLNGKPKAQNSLALEQLLESFFENLPNGNLEDTTLYGMQVHKRHLLRILGESFAVQKLTLAHLQDYVGTRSKEAGIRGRRVGANTINKEIVTLQSVWNWAVQMGMLEEKFPRAGLRFPKTTEKPRFQTWEEIERQIEQGNLTDAEQAELWGCLFLSLDEIDELLAYVKQVAQHSFIYPMFVLAAHTGARRSELIRSRVNDFDGDTIIIHERKRVRGKQTTRRVPMSSICQPIMQEWLNNHPGGQHTFCLGSVSRSKKSRSGPQPITRSEATDHFQRTLRGSKWEKICGWHCFRHSFCSNCALKGIDQRIIDSFVGHTTETMSRRYRHLFPNSQRDAMQLVFG